MIPVTIIAITVLPTFSGFYPFTIMYRYSITLIVCTKQFAETLINFIWTLQFPPRLIEQEGYLC
jgi:hypothetical protein